MALVEPGLSPERAGWLVDGEGWLDPRALAPAVHAAALSAGVRCVQTEVLGVGEGEVLTAAGALRGTVVVCAGAWTAQVPGLTALPVRPLRGQVLALLSPAGFRLGHVVFGAGGYLVPRTDGRVLVGSTMEDVGFARGVTSEGMAKLRATARQLCPALEDAAELETWSGFRPSTPDGLPLLGTVRGIWVASGHHRNGILLAPYTAMSVADAILEGAPLPPSLRADRFSA
jgi:glycine oxidase